MARTGYNRNWHEVCDESCTAPASAPAMALLARIFLPAASPAEAHAQDHFLQAALTTFAPRAQHPPKPYWKEPDWYEHCFELTKFHRRKV